MVPRIARDGPVGGASATDLRRMCVGLYVGVMIFFAGSVSYICMYIIFERRRIEGCVYMRFTEALVARLSECAVNPSGRGIIATYGAS